MMRGCHKSYQGPGGVALPISSTGSNVRKGATTMTCLRSPHQGTARVSCRRRPSVTLEKRLPTRANYVMTLLHALTWYCVILLAVLSLLPAQQMVRTGLVE